MGQSAKQQEQLSQVNERMFCQAVQDPVQTQTMDLLKANPFIQRLIKERVSVLEARMKSRVITR